MRKYLNLRANIALGLLFTFLVNTVGPCPVYAQEFTLPAPGQMVALSPAYNPAVLKGIKLDPKNPFRFHFFVDTGDSYKKNMSSSNKKNMSSPNVSVGDLEHNAWTSDTNISFWLKFVVHVGTVVSQVFGHAKKLSQN